MSYEQNETLIYFYKTCINLPPQVDSHEPWCEPTDSGPILVNSLPVLQGQMCIIFFGTLMFKCIFSRFGIICSNVYIRMSLARVFRIFTVPCISLLSKFFVFLTQSRLNKFCRFKKKKKLRYHICEPIHTFILHKKNT